jgi:hypothetical protein
VVAVPGRRGEVAATRAVQVVEAALLRDVAVPAGRGEPDPGGTGGRRHPGEPARDRTVRPLPRADRRELGGGQVSIVEPAQRGRHEVARLHAVRRDRLGAGAGAATRAAGWPAPRSATGAAGR